MDGGGGISEVEQNQKTCGPLEPHPRQESTLAAVLALCYHAESNGRPRDRKNQFYGTVTLDPIKAKLDFATIMDEVVQQFTSKLGVEVRISVEIQAQGKDGFDDALQRAIKENCNVLSFDSSEFE